MFFNIFDHPLFDYQLSTPVVSIERVDAPIPGHFPECGWDGLVKTIAACKCFYPGMDREYGVQFMERKDFYIGPLHIIMRGYRENPQYGMLFWGKNIKDPTLDVWIKQTLFTFRLDDK